MTDHFFARLEDELMCAFRAWMHQWQCAMAVCDETATVEKAKQWEARLHGIAKTFETNVAPRRKILSEGKGFELVKGRAADLTTICDVLTSRARDYIELSVVFGEVHVREHTQEFAEDILFDSLCAPLHLLISSYYHLLTPTDALLKTY